MAPLLAVLRGFLLLALLWAGSVAPGTMPARGADGAPAFVLCTGEGERLVVLDAEGRPVPVEAPGERGGHPPPCAFAALPLPLVPERGLLWRLPDGRAVAAESVAPPVLPVPGPRPEGAHRPRGPPAVRSA